MQSFLPYLKLLCVTNVPFEEDYTPDSVIMNQRLDFGTGCEAMEPDCEKLKHSVSGFLATRSGILPVRLSSSSLCLASFRLLDGVGSMQQYFLRQLARILSGEQTSAGSTSRAG